MMITGGLFAEDWIYGYGSGNLRLFHKVRNRDEDRGKQIANQMSRGIYIDQLRVD